ncbi:MAG: iron ABC transporter permease [Firmicutes bacterium]|nr:iron ABC transporter permease [Bacillota bacterium]
MNRPTLRLFCILLLLLLTACFMGICMGSQYISPACAYRVLSGAQTDLLTWRILQYVRLPRLCAGLLAGMALGLSGAVIQNVLGNPLAAPNIIGVNSGAGFAVALAGVLFPGMVLLTPAAAFLGALISVFAVLKIAKATEASKSTIILAGVALSSIFSAGTETVITLWPDALTHNAQFRIGGLANLPYSKFTVAGLVILLSSLAVFALAPMLDVLMLGDETAKSLGLRTRRIRSAFLVLAAALAGAAVSFSGILGFIGLIIPHAIRHFTGEENSRLLPACALAGASFLVICDTAARTLFSPFELPVGIVLSVLGGPFFIFLVLKKRGGHSNG